MKPNLIPALLLASAAATGGAALVGYAAVAQDAPADRFVYLEAEGLLPALESFASNPAGTETQAIARRQNNCCGFEWSSRAQALFENFTPGARMTLRFEVPESATYGVAAVFTRAPDFGILEFSVDGRRLGPRLDGYAPAPERSAQTGLGSVALAEGSHTLTLTVVGKNPAASNHFAGLDYVELRYPGPTPSATPSPTPTATPTATPGTTPGAAGATPGGPGAAPAPPAGPAPGPRGTGGRRPAGLVARVGPRVDRRRPYRFTVSGRLALPAGVRPADGCQGRVSLQVKAGTRTLSNRRVRVTPACTFRQPVTFSNARRFAGRSRLTVLVSFNGNGFLLPKRAASVRVRVR